MQTDRTAEQAADVVKEKEDDVPPRLVGGLNLEVKGGIEYLDDKPICKCKNCCNPLMRDDNECDCDRRLANEMKNNAKKFECDCKKCCQKDKKD